MRKKKEILKEFSINKPNNILFSRMNQKLFLEVLLDIRNQLRILNKPKKKLIRERFKKKK